MSVLLRDKNGQVDLSGGKIQFISGNYEARRRNEMYLRLFTGEAVTDPERGIDYLGFIMGDKTTLRQISAYLKTKILSIPGNRAVSEFSLSPPDSNRQLTVSYTVSTSLSDEPVKISEPLRFL
jgi:hypothetical protein